MIRKWVSKALLSVVMEKSARDKLARRKEAKAAPGPATEAAPAPPAERRRGDDDLHVKRAEALAAKLAEAVDRLERINAARLPGEAAAKAADPATRDELLARAREIHRANRRALDRLDPEDRLRLSVMAEKLFGMSGGRKG